MAIPLATIGQYALGQPALYTRFVQARIQAAWDVVGTGTTAQKAWAAKVFADPYADGNKEYVWCLSHALIQAAGDTITDANLVAAVSSFVTAWSA